MASASKPNLSPALYYNSFLPLGITCYGSDPDSLLAPVQQTPISLPPSMDSPANPVPVKLLMTTLTF